MSKKLFLMIAFLPAFALLTNCAMSPDMLESEVAAEHSAALTTRGTLSYKTTGSTNQCKETQQKLSRAEAKLGRISKGLTTATGINAGTAAAGTCYCCPSMSVADGNCSPHPCGFACPGETIAAYCGDGEVLIIIDGEFKCAISGT